VEPRKGYAQAVAAFELLWTKGYDLRLVIVGKQGWMVRPLTKKLKRHPRLGTHLFWLENISDAYLKGLYAACSCLLVASEGEGFGLPLIEAAQQKLPIMARDLPVFRELAGDHASYFSGTKPEDLAQTVTDWLKLFNEGRHPKSDGMPWLTWRQSAERLRAILFEGKWYASWPAEPNTTSDEVGFSSKPHRPLAVTASEVE